MHLRVTVHGVSACQSIVSVMCLLIACGQIAWPGLAIGATPPSAQTNVLQPETLAVEPTLKWSLSIGGDDDPDLPPFGHFTRCKSRTGGGFLLLDWQLKQAFTVSDDGSDIQPLGREGEGPGEYGMPADVLTDTEDRPCILHAFPPKLIRFDNAGDPLPNLELCADRYAAATDVRSCNEHYIAACSHYVSDHDGGYDLAYLGVFSGIGQLLDRVGEFRVADDEVAEAAQLGFEGTWCATESGRIVLAADFDRYLLTMHGLDGSQLAEIERESIPILRTEGELSYLLESRFGPDNSRFKLCEHHRAIHSVFSVGQGFAVVPAPGIWRPRPGAIIEFDLFDDRGAFCRRIVVKGDDQRIPITVEIDSEHLILVYLDDPRLVRSGVQADASEMKLCVYRMPEIVSTLVSQ